VPPNWGLAKILSAKDVLAAVPAKAAKDWQQLTHTMEQLLAENSTPQKIRIIIEAMYDEFLKANFEDYANRRDDLGRLAEFASSFATLQEFLEQMALLTSVESEAATSGESREAIWLSTVHQAKGLEWHTVFIIGLADEMFPSIRALEARGGEEEERRLFYVAITRAKDELYLSFPMTRGGRGGDFGMNRPSRFLKDIPQQLFDAWKISINLPVIQQGNPRRPLWDEDHEKMHGDD
jgi:DNA helicase-2/ATP-dependent DNA helicase PcrA